MPVRLDRDGADRTLRARGCSDDTGRFQTSGIGPGTTDLRVYDLAGRYLETRVGAVAVPLGGVADIGTLTLQLGASLSGRVTGSGGEPVTDLCMSIDAPDLGDDYTCTDDDGRYTTIGLPTGEYEVRWHTVGAYLPPVTATVTLTAPSSTRYDLRAQLGGSLGGLITAADTGAPLSGICVVAQLVGGFSSGGGDFTGADGRYTVVGLDHGPDTRYRVVANGVGAYLTGFHGGGDYSTAPGVAVGDLTPVTGVDVALTRGATVAGRVTDASACRSAVSRSPSSGSPAASGPRSTDP